MKLRVALYARVSTEEQALHGLSIEAQLAALREAYPNGEEYVDLGISARKPISKRPELQRLLKDVQADKIDLIAFTKLDRWTRNIGEYYKCQEILDAHKVAWRALFEDYETETASGRFKVNIMLAVAESEADRTSERIKSVFDNLRSQGKVTNGSRAVGLEIKDGVLVAGNDADKVREIFQYYISSRSTTQTARMYTLPRRTVTYILTNKNYIKTGVIDQTTWETVQQIRTVREQRTVRGDRVYLFSGILSCPYCGMRMTAYWTHDKYVSYRCQKKYEGRCIGKIVKEEILEAYLLDHLMPEVEGVNLTIREKQKKKGDVVALKRKRDKLTDLYMNDLIDRKKYETDFKSLSAQIEEAEKEPKPIDTEQIMTVLEAYQSLSRRAKKAFWSNLLKSVTPTEDGFIFTLNNTY